MRLMLRAGYVSARLVEVRVTKKSDTHVWLQGVKDQINCGYVRYFNHDEREKAKEWIVNKHNRLTTKKITTEEVYEIRIEDLSDKERASGKLRQVKERKQHRGVSVGRRRKR